MVSVPAPPEPPATLLNVKEPPVVGKLAKPVPLNPALLESMVTPPAITAASAWMVFVTPPEPPPPLGVALAWPEFGLSPAAFTAETTKKYVVPFTRPELTNDVPVFVLMLLYGPPLTVARLTR